MDETHNQEICNNLLKTFVHFLKENGVTLIYRHNCLYGRCSAEHYPTEIRTPFEPITFFKNHDSINIFSPKSSYFDICNVITFSFLWGETNEGYMFWLQLHFKWKEIVEKMLCGS